MWYFIYICKLSTGTGMKALTPASDGNGEKDTPSLLNYSLFESRNKRYNPVLFVRPGLVTGCDASVYSFLQSSNKAKTNPEFYKPIRNPPDVSNKKYPTIRFLNFSGLMFYYV